MAAESAISGNTAVGGATVDLSGDASASTTADGSGNYSFGGLANGSYTVTPSLAGYAFTPPLLNVIVQDVGVAGVNFTATVVASVPALSSLLRLVAVVMMMGLGVCYALRFACSPSAELGQDGGLG